MVFHIRQNTFTQNFRQMGEALDKMMASMEAEKATAIPSPAPAPISPAPAATAVAPAPAAEQPIHPAEEQPKLEPVLTPATAEAPKLSAEQEAYIKNIYEQPATEAPAEPKAATISDKEKKLIEDAEKLMSDPLFKALKEIRENDGDLKELVIACKKCKSTIRLEGFESLDQFGNIDEPDKE